MILNRVITAKNTLNNKQMQDGQTLFEYLKRKKEITLKQTMSKSFNRNQNANPYHQSHKSYLKQFTIQKKSKHKKNSNKKRNQSSQSQKQNNRKNANKSNLSTKIQKKQGKITTGTASYATHRYTSHIQQNKQQQQFKLEPEYENISKKVSNTRSFISMISPLKNRERSLSNCKVKYPVKNQNKMQENYLKKSIKQKISQIEQQFQIKSQFQKQVKQKLKHLNSTFLSIINEIQQNDQILDKFIGLDKKIRNGKTSIKLIHSFFTNKQTSHTSQQNKDPLSQLYNLMIENVDNMQGQIKNECNSRTNKEISTLKEQYQQKIDSIQKQKHRLSRQITLNSKKTQKIQAQYNNLLQKYNQLEENFLQINQKHKQIHNTQKNQMQITIDTIIQQNNKLIEDKHKLEKRLKDADYRLEDFSRKNKKKSQEKINERQVFLMKEVQMLKNEYSKDIECMNSFQHNKQEKLRGQLKQFQCRICEQSLMISQLQQCLRQNSRQMLVKDDQIKQHQQQKQSTLLDLYRLNQELYRHWYCLKDIKTLLYKINLYDKFHTIYRELGFDEGLFNN